MALYAITFRIADRKTTLGTYQDRYDSFVDRVRYEAAGTWWEETTSFFLIESDLGNSKALADSLAANSIIDETNDLAVIINLSSKGYSVIGKNPDPDLGPLMKKR